MKMDRLSLRSRAGEECLWRGRRSRADPRLVGSCSESRATFVPRVALLPSARWSTRRCSGRGSTASFGATAFPGSNQQPSRGSNPPFGTDAARDLGGCRKAKPRPPHRTGRCDTVSSVAQIALLFAPPASFSRSLPSHCGSEGSHSSSLLGLAEEPGDLHLEGGHQLGQSPGDHLPRLDHIHARHFRRPEVGGVFLGGPQIPVGLSVQSGVPA